MKRIISLRNKMAILLLAMLAGVSAFAQDDPSVYDTPPKHDFLQFIGPGILFILILYVGYRYWLDNKTDDKHTPHHP